METSRNEEGLKPRAQPRPGFRRARGEIGSNQRAELGGDTPPRRPPSDRRSGGAGGRNRTEGLPAGGGDRSELPWEGDQRSRARRRIPEYWRATVAVSSLREARR